MSEKGEKGVGMHRESSSPAEVHDEESRGGIRALSLSIYIYIYIYTLEVIMMLSTPAFRA